MSGRIEPCGPGKWRLTIELGRDAGGTRRRKKITFEGSERAANRELSRLVTEVAAGQHPAGAGRTTVEAFLLRWLKVYAESNVQPRTAAEYEKVIRGHLIPSLGRLPLTKLTPLHLQQYYAAKQKGGRLDGKGGLSGTTVLAHHRLLHEALKHAVRWGLVYRNVTEMVDPPAAETPEMQVLDEAGVVRLLAHLRGHWLFLPALLSVSTSYRRGEVLGLQWSDVDLKSGLVHLRRSVEVVKRERRVKQPKAKKGRRRPRPPVELLAFVVDELVQVKRERAALAAGPLWKGGPLESSLICCWDDGSPFLPDSVSAAFGKVSRKLGLGIRFHDLRHTHLTSLLAAGEPVNVVSARGGHASAKMTLDVYGHTLPGQGRGASDRMNERLQKAREELERAGSDPFPGPEGTNRAQAAEEEE